MIIANLTRGYFDDEVTLGMLQFKGVWHQPIYTLERPWLDNERNVSCIPEDIYFTEPYTSTRYPDVYELQDVLERSKILLHAGNTVHDTQGCILPGLASGELNDEPAVLQSRNALNIIRNIVGDRPFILSIGD